MHIEIHHICDVIIKKSLRENLKNGCSRLLDGHHGGFRVRLFFLLFVGSLLTSHPRQGCAVRGRGFLTGGKTDKYKKAQTLGRRGPVRDTKDKCGLIDHLIAPKNLVSYTGALGYLQTTPGAMVKLHQGWRKIVCHSPAAKGRVVIPRTLS